MRVASIKLRNFKRFTDLEIAEIPKSAKLVVVVGPNGSGKSSLFDALAHWHRFNTFHHTGEMRYYRKLEDESFEWGKAVSVNLHDGAVPKKGSLYIRTAYRNDPEFQIDGINRPENPAETVRIHRLIENDQSVSQNYRRLVYETMAGVYSEANDSKTVRALREELIGTVRESMKRVFGDLILNNVADPLGGGTFFFQKGWDCSDKKDREVRALS